MKLFKATIEVVIDADACGNNKAGACDWFSGLLSDNNDVFDWAYGCKHIKGHPAPEMIEVDERTYQEGDFLTWEEA